MQFLVKDILNNKNLLQAYVRTTILGSPVGTRTSRNFPKKQQRNCSSCQYGLFPSSVTFVSDTAENLSVLQFTSSVKIGQIIMLLQSSFGYVAATLRRHQRKGTNLGCSLSFSLSLSLSLYL